MQLKTGIGPATTAWEAVVLPLHHLSVKKEFRTENSFLQSGEDGIRTHAPVKTNGFQDRPVMTASVPLLSTSTYHFHKSHALAATDILSKIGTHVNNYFIAKHTRL